MLRRAEDLVEFLIRGSDGAVGRVHDLYFHDRVWAVGYLALNTGDWPISRFILLPCRAVRVLNWQDRRGSVALNREQVRSIPEIKPTSTLLWKDCQELDGCFGWSDRTSVGIAAQETHIRSDLPAERGQVLRSVREILGYQIDIEGTAIGRIQDVLFDDETWLIRYLYVDVWSWSPRQKELVPPNCVVKIDSSEARIHAVRRHKVAPTGLPTASERLSATP